MPLHTRPLPSLSSSKEFVGDVSKEAMWAHMDIAGPVWNDKMGGATGYGVRTLVGLVESMDA